MAEQRKPSIRRSEMALLFAIVLGLLLGIFIKRIKVGIMIGLVLGLLVILTGWLRVKRR